MKPVETLHLHGLVKGLPIMKKTVLGPLTTSAARGHGGHAAAGRLLLEITLGQHAEVTHAVHGIQKDMSS